MPRSNTLSKAVKRQLSRKTTIEKATQDKGNYNDMDYRNGSYKRM